MTDSARPGASRASSPGHLLVVEDDEGLQELFRQQLAATGLAIHSAATGCEALAWLSPRPDCLMLLDYSLPDMTARGVIERLGDSGPPPFIIITGHGDERIAVEMMKLGARDYVVKDAHLLDRLPAVVERVLREIEGQRRLAASEHKFQAIFEGSDDALMLLNEAGFLDCNQRALELFGVDHKSAFHGKHPAELSPPTQPDGRDSREAAQQRITAALAGNAQRFEWLHRRWDGGVFPAEVLLSPFELEGRTVLQATVRDITERKRAQVDLQESERRLATLMANLPGMVYRCANQPAWPMEFVNEGCAALTGFPPGDLLRQRPSYGELIVSEDRQSIWDAVQVAVRVRGPFELNYRIQTANGQIKWVWERGQGVFGSEGQLLFLEGFITDVTSRQQAEEALRDSEEKFRLLLQNANDAVFVHEISPVGPGRFLEVNERACSMLGYTREELLKMSVGEVDVPEQAARMPGILESLRTTQQAVFETEHQTKDGRRIPVEISARQFLLHDAPTILSVIRDITERKRTEAAREALLSLQARLSEARTPKDAARTIFEAADRLWNWDCGWVDLYSRAEDRAEPLLNYDIVAGQRREVAPVDVSGTPSPRVRRVLEHGAELILRVPPFSQPDDVVMFGDTTRLSAAILCVPIRRQGQPVGVLSVQSYTPNAFTRDDLNTLQSLADQCGGALERIRAEEALRESEVRFREIIENSQAGYFRIDRAGRFVTVNGAWLRMHGYTAAAEVVGQHFSLTQVEADLPTAQAIVERLLAGEAVPEAEFTRRCQDGTIGCHTFSAHPIHADNTVAGLEGFLIDTTLLKRAQADYAMLFEKMLDGFALHEMIFNGAGQPVDYRFLAVNPGFEHMTGLPAKTVLGRTMLEVSPQTEPFWIETYGRVVVTGEPEFFEHFSKELGRHFEVSAFRPAPGQFACVIVDVTGRKQAEAEILRYQAQLEAIYDNAPLMMCLINEQREIERMNRAMAELAGRSLSADEAQRPGDILGCLNALDNPAGCGAGPHCRTCPLRLAMLETFRTGQSQSRVETSLFLARKGQRREVRVAASTALVRIAGEARLLLCLEDITVRRQLEQQFLQAQKMEAVGQLAGGVAHDFNNILAAIIMHLHLLQETKGLDASVAGALKEVQGYAHRAADLTRQLLLFSRRKAAQPKRLDANTVIEAMMKMLHRVLGENIEMKFAAAPEGQWVDADPGMLEQVVMNLCVNARDAMPQGGHLTLALAMVEISLEQAQQCPNGREGRFVRLSVRDTGCGMDEATLKRIFEPFFTTKEAGKGTGLGLATVYGIVQQHQGWLSVESAVGIGTTFHVHLPRTAAPETSFTENDASVMPPGSETILLVEDEPGLLNLGARILRRCGYRVLEARSGAEGLRVWSDAAGQVHLVFTDMVMPGGLGGLELIERLRQSKPGLKAILSSGYSQELARQGVETHAPVRFLAKPYEPSTLARVVREVLDEK